MARRWRGQDQQTAPARCPIVPVNTGSSVGDPSELPQARRRMSTVRKPSAQPWQSLIPRPVKPSRLGWACARMDDLHAESRTAHSAIEEKIFGRDLLGPRRMAGGRAITLRHKLACARKQLLAADHKSALPSVFDP